MRKDNVFVAKIAKTRLTKTCVAIFALAERLPTSATLVMIMIIENIRKYGNYLSDSTQVNISKISVLSSILNRSGAAVGEDRRRKISWKGERNSLTILELGEVQPPLHCHHQNQHHQRNGVAILEFGQV